ncbi:hypothetical protein WR25_07357 [Diploscapter pachys]|uniref:Uncharacterized protein n=1 Tax=Diploscapter pachys TaxID=2018661 RepID=A0A2A2KBA4_9BILA|nr:hypothetical protein WR25_07357 [Diploscapter pachys]
MFYLFILCSILKISKPELLNGKGTSDIRIVWDYKREKDTAVPVYTVNGRYFMEVEQLLRNKSSPNDFVPLKRALELNPNGKWMKRLVQSKDDVYRNRQKRERCSMQGKAQMTREGNMGAFVYTGEHGVRQSQSYQIRNGTMGAIVYSQSDVPCQGVSLYWIIPAIAPHKGARKKRFIMEDGTRVEYYDDIYLRALPLPSQRYPHSSNPAKFRNP